MPRTDTQKLWPMQVTMARQLRRKGHSYGELADYFGVAKSTARKAILGITYKDCPEPPCDESFNRSTQHIRRRFLPCVVRYIRHVYNRARHYVRKPGQGV